MAGRTRQPESLDAWLSGLSAGQLECRDLGHQWAPYAGGWHSEAGAWTRTLRCRRCRTERIQTLNRMGVVLANRYNYSTGYIRKPDPNEEPIHVTRDLFRMQSLERFLQKDGGK